MTTVKSKIQKKHVNEEVKMTMVEFHPQSTQDAVDKHTIPYEQSELPLDDAVESESHQSAILFYRNLKKLQVNILYFALPGCPKQERSVAVAPSIFNIKAQGLDHCILWENLS